MSTDVTRYLEFRQIAGSYVQQGSGPKATVAKVPSDAAEALRSPLMGLFEKRRMKSFIEWVGTFNLKDPATHKGQEEKLPRSTHSSGGGGSMPPPPPMGFFANQRRRND